MKKKNRTFYNAKYAMRSITKQAKSPKYYHVDTLFAWYVYFRYIIKRGKVELNAHYAEKFSIMKMQKMSQLTLLFWVC